MHTVYLGLGTNLGDRQHNLHAATEALPPGLQVEEQSKVYETPAWGYEDQPAFLNIAVRGQTELAPADLLAYLKAIELRLGRTATFRWGPRLIDIDILFYDDLVLETPELVIPHPRLHERAFVVVPLRDIAANLVHPVLGKSVQDLARGLDTSGIRPA